ncbi:MAG TPA: carboxypeptidase-like regulatory domain-containing protein [Thermoanaerobaculia bacterium]|nr:carboxypeptidase-like regulatory domain-containing protein [Thermoanaerobaculia bacterium]
MLRHLLPFLIGAVSIAAGAANVALPSPRDGNVNGIGGVLFWPGDMFGSDGEPRPLATAEGCEAHLVPYTEPDRELVYPCGKWFVLPSAGYYSHWLETKDRITPTIGLMLYGRKPFSGAGMASVVPVAAAGHVMIPPGKTMSGDEDLRFVSIESRYGWGTRVFDRRVAAAKSHAPVQMPVGRAVVGRFDHKSNDAIALSPPLEIADGKTAVVWPMPPAESDVLLVLARPPDVPAKPFPVHLVLDQRPPDVLLNAFERIIAIWYGVAGRHATLSMQSDAAYWPPQEINLTRGKVTTIRSSIQRLPKAHVSIVVPPGAAITEPMSLEAGGRYVSVTPGMHVLNDLPAQALKITLSIGAWKLLELADLSSGQDANVTFELKPIAVTGTVFHGDERVPAEIEFLNDKEWRTVKTNDRGEFATTFWWPKVHTARIKIANLPPYLDTFREIVDSDVVDFHVPRTDYLVRVRDATTGKGIANAQVSVGNDSPDTRVTTQRITTDAAGVAVLPPLRGGDLILNAWAEHYARSEPLRASVDDRHHELEIVLKPVPTAATLQLRLSSGAPAAQAEAWAFDRAMTPLWRGTADEGGRLDLPELTNPLLLVRHPMAASTIRALAPHDEAWTLDPPAAPLTLVSKPGVVVALWLDGVKLTGPPLTFAAWSTPMTTANGLWVARNLPARPLRVLLLPGSAFGSNAYDAVARSIDYPWSGPVAAPVVQ